MYLMNCELGWDSSYAAGFQVRHPREEAHPTRSCTAALCRVPASGHSYLHGL